MTTGPAIVVEGLVAGHAAAGFRLRVPRFEVGRGEAVALVGPSGCGKTTFLHTLAGVLPALSGRVTLDGTPWSAADGRAEAARRRFRLRRLGLVFQELELLEHLDVRQNLLLAWHLGAGPCPWAQAEERALRTAQALGLTPHLARRPRVLSQGERQRVAVARALLPEPPILLADEPTGNLDAENARRVLALLLDAARGRGAALLIVTHDATLLPGLDRVVELPRLAAEAP